MPREQTVALGLVLPSVRSSRKGVGKVTRVFHVFAPRAQPQGVTVPREPRIIFTNTAMVEAARHRAPKRFEERLQQTAVDHQK